MTDEIVRDAEFWILEAKDRARVKLESLSVVDDTLFQQDEPAVEPEEEDS